MFGDLVGSTALQETLDPESVRRVMSRFYDVMRGAVARHNGHVDRFVGDGVLVVFGVPASGEDDALRAVRCAAAMVADLEMLGEELEQRWDVRLRMRTGVNTGEVVVSDEEELVGDAMNIAARLEQAAAPGEVLVGEATWQLVRRRVQLEQIEPLAVKGKAAPVRAWRLRTTDPPAATTGAAEAPMVGREAQLSQLREALDRAETRRSCQLVTVIGSPGMGKTRLSSEFCSAMRARATVVRARCEASDAGVTFGPVAELIRAIAGIGDTDPAAAVREKLTTIVGPEPDAERIVARTGSVLGVSESVSIQETFWGVRRLLEAVARRRALVVVFDDVHWGQPVFLDLIEHLAQWVREVPILLLVVARPELREIREVLTIPGRWVCDVVELVGLGEADTVSLIDAVLGRTDLPDDVVDRLLSTTEGNPLFLGESVRMLVDERLIALDGDVWVRAGSETMAVPPTIQALLTARIERLRHEERAVVERAAVIGKQFYRGAVASLVPAPVGSGLDGHLEMLRRKEIVEPEGTYWIDEPVYRFHHVLIRDAAYGLLLKEARADLHERYAEWLQAKAGEMVGEHEEVIAYHLEQAHEYRRQLGAADDHWRQLGVRAAEMLGSSGRRALVRGDLAAAANLLGRAVERVGGDDPDLLWDWAEALLSAGDTAAARIVVARLAPGNRSAVLAGQIAVMTGTADTAGIVAELTAAAEELAATGDELGAAKAHHVAADGLVQIGRLGDAEAALDRALAAARTVTDRRRTTAVLAAAPRAALWGPTPMVRSSGRCLDVLRILRMTPGNRHVEAIALRCQAVLEAARGRFDAAREVLGTARATLRELGLAWELHELAIYAGIVELLAGSPQAAQPHLEQARDGFAALGGDVGAAQAAALLGRAFVEQGRDAEAIEQTRFAEQHAGGEFKATITWCAARAEALARRGEHAEALALARRAVELAEPTDALTDRADAAMALARVCHTIGQPDQARAAAQTAQMLYQDKDHTVGMTRAAGLLGAPAPATPSAAAATHVLGGRPPERVLADFLLCMRARDLDQMLQLFVEGAVWIDHRPLMRGDTHGRDGLRRLYESTRSASPDIQAQVADVIGCDDRVIAASWTVYGTTTDSGGTFEIPLGVVASVDEDGLITAWHQYSPDDHGPMVARFAELGGGIGPLDDRPSAYNVAEYCRLCAARDVDGLVALHAEDFKRIDHRVLAWEETGNDREQWSSFFAAASDAWWAVNEVLACDDRVIAFTCTYRGRNNDGGGQFEMSLGVVAVIENGLRTAEHHYQPEEREAMLVQFAELGGCRAPLGDQPPERALSAFLFCMRQRDLEQMVELFAEDAVRVDHRALGDEIRGREELARLFASTRSASPDIRAQIADVIACDHQAIACRFTASGTTVDGGGAFEIPMGLVVSVRDELITHWHCYEPGDHAAMLARFAELGGVAGCVERLHPTGVECAERRSLDASS